jgi:hypothetical protein
MAPGARLGGPSLRAAQCRGGILYFCMMRCLQNSGFCRFYVLAANFVSSTKCNEKPARGEYAANAEGPGGLFFQANEGFLDTL